MGSLSFLWAFIVILIVGFGSVVVFQSRKKMNETVGVEEEKEVSATHIRNVDIRMPNASIRIVPGDTDQMRIKLVGKVADYQQDDFQVEERQGTLSVKFNKKLKRRFKWFGHSGDTLALTVYFPEKQFDSIHVSNANGKLEAEQLRVNELKAVTTNGKVVIRETKAATVHMKLANGKLVLDHVEGALTGETANGSILLTTSSLDHPIQFTTNNGAIDIQTKKIPTNATIHARVVNGKVNVFGESGRSHVYGAGEHQINISTVNGVVKMSEY
ncbi:DUF4097 domain-containing protein [Bacillaceae bacterium SIJ1]|uniref:DUF4097 family beta strand repeat-containing protein n=1 Tax=Litoribacterium kuwaitense TaxID=1398745 RepID=UPI0013E9B820|nr:DUF4097 family beta strand repeat-containing protein [Litoribacterium kuwaitense]NGP46224.1 DUF4097 domain-containing protein [Litoribacterium kuwaitense]